MSRVVLRQVLGRSEHVRRLVDAVQEMAGGHLSVEDARGAVLHGQPLAPTVERTVVTFEEATLGAVAGGAGRDFAAALLSHLVAKESEQKALGAEVLHLYREINLIYSFSEKLAALLDVQAVADLTLQEARHLIVATDGLVMLLDDATGELRTVSAFGDEMPTVRGLQAGHGILGTVVASGVGEIVNDVDRDTRRVVHHTGIKALIAAPLTVGERVIGLVALGSTVPMHYPAAGLKLLTTLSLQAATAVENARLFERTVQAAQERERLMALHQAAEVARTKLESELKLAARIQSDLFPAAMPVIPGYDIAAHNRPARQCGGDYYDTIAPAADPAGPVLLCVADVSGKGLPAALVMANMQATLRALLGVAADLPALAQRASELLFASTSPEKYVTAALAELHPASGALRFVGAGHVDNLILRADGRVETLSSTGMPLGLVPELMPFGQLDLHLHPGDALVLFSDGVPEAQNPEGDEFGEERLLQSLAAASSGPARATIERVMAAIDGFGRGASQYDDITLLVVRRLPATA